MISIARNEGSTGATEGTGEMLALARDYLADARDVVKNVVNQRPALALGVALATGVLLGWLIKRR